MRKVSVDKKQTNRESHLCISPHLSGSKGGDEVCIGFHRGSRISNHSFFYRTASFHHLGCHKEDVLSKTSTSQGLKGCVENAQA
jgi:hypothetical protein